MAIPTTKHALLFAIILVSMNGINSQLLTTIFAVRDITALLENITDTSTVTSMFLANILNRSADTQSRMDGSLDQIENTQTQMADTQSEMASTESRMEATLDQMANTQSQMANTLTQVVQLLQMQNEQSNQIIPQIPRDCSDLSLEGPFKDYDGVYNISAWDDVGIFPVYCDTFTNNVGWTVFQRRFDGSVDFYLGWDDYEDGFGSPDGEYWLGLGQLHRLTRQGSWMLRIDLADFQDNTAYAEYESFSIGDAESNYTLSVGAYNGDAGDSLIFHNNQAFSTKDNDNDSWSADCAESGNGAWWYNACHHSNLNGLYLGESQNSPTGMVWLYWKNSWEVLKRSEMKIRRIR